MNRKRQTNASTFKLIKKKKVIALDVKIDIIRRFEAGEKPASIGRILGLAPSTIKSICHRDALNIKKLSRVATDSQAKSTVMNRSALIIQMESLLVIWIDRQNHLSMPLSKMVIQAKAKAIFDDLQEGLPISSEAIKEDFVASSGWFERFKFRANLHNIFLKGEAASADLVAAKEFCDHIFPAAVKEGGYNSSQVFNVDETGLFWKRLPKRTYISRQESAAPGFKVSKDRLTLLLGGNANGDCKLKPLLVYHSENPRALKGVDKMNLPVYWRANRKAWVTGVLFLDWVKNCAIPEFKKYCETENLEFKILVLLDNAPGHPAYLDDMCDNVKFLFMPPNTTSVIQPMDQGVISNFKSYYLRRTFKQLLSATDANDTTTMKEFWKNYNVLKAVNNIGDSWNEVKLSCMNGVWRKIWPECIKNHSEVDEISLVRQEVVNLANSANFEGMDDDGFDEILNSNEDTTDILTQDLLEMCSSNTDVNFCDVPEEKKLTTKRIAQALALINEGIEIFLNEDPDKQQSAQAAQTVKSSISFYEKIYLEKKKRDIQMTLDNYVQHNINNQTKN